MTLNFRYIQFALLSAGFLGLYYPFLIPLIQDWDSNPNYSHGYFIPLISAYMIYSLKEELARIDLKPTTWGLLLIALGFLQLIVAKVGSEFFLQRTSLIVVLFGMALFLAGASFTKKISLPILYLIFMIPLPAIVWNKIAFPMQLFASSITESVVHLIGIPIFRQGNVLHLAETTLEVVDACSGIRSLTTLTALSAALAFFTETSTTKKWIIFLSAAPIAILANVIRLTGTAILASKFGGDVAHGFLHDFSGWLIFVCGLLILLVVRHLLLSPPFSKQKE